MPDLLEHSPGIVLPFCFQYAEARLEVLWLLRELSEHGWEHQLPDLLEHSPRVVYPT